ncbi:hypothetical protein AWB68_08213 [Caballeronia choica]|uniref:Restriction endonuclease type IV Mrr domain-containing protein n=1 Tax=Caballeronia choica TaxID=326476 RepID=A0A158L0P5_9BURK|nr:restriction endonuclease [Caballeronia choica]SAL86947.1 hypothetical protein AWB68_08213 [Caballeronia choica]
MAPPSRTTNRLHFEDLSPSRFEDLSLALVYRLHRWEEIHHDGRSGADDGVDIRAMELAKDGSIRVWAVQCKRYGRFTGADAKAAVREAVAKASTPPDVMLLVVGCDVSISARSAYERAASTAGIGSAILWAASVLETKLYSDHPDLLFSFFGVSLARRERGRENDLRRTLAMKRKLKRVFGHGEPKPAVIIHSIDDEVYPSVDTAGSGTISPWFRAEFAGHYHTGIEVYIGLEHIIVDRSDNAWSTMEFGKGGLGAASDPEKAFANTRYDVLKVFIVGRIPFRNIFDVDEDGDEYYPGPHLYCRYADAGEPYEMIVRREVDGYKEYHQTDRFPFRARDTR